MLTKENINRIPDFLIPLALCVIVASNFTIMGHIAVSSIAVGCLAGFIFIKYILTGINHIDFKRNIPFYWWMGIYAVHAISLAIQGENPHNIRYSMQFKFILPVYAIVIMFLPSLKQKHYFLFFKIFIATICVLSLKVLYNYYDLIILNHGEGIIHPTWRSFIDMLYPFIIPFKIIHHTFSFFLLFGCFWVYYLLKNENQLRFSKYILYFLFLFLAFMLHFVSARLCLLLFYLSILIEISRLTLNKTITYKISIGIAVSAFLLLFTAYQTIPTLRNKINFTVLNKVSPGEIIATESSQKNIRLISLQVGWQALKENLWSGISVGEEDEYFKNLNGLYFHEEGLLKMRPHNQFLYNAAVLGLPLSLILAFLFYFPLFYKFRENDVSLIFLYIIITAYFFTDNPLQQKQFFYFVAFWVPFMKLYSMAKAQKFENILEQAKS